MRLFRESPGRRFCLPRACRKGKLGGMSILLLTYVIFFLLLLVAIGALGYIVLFSVVPMIRGAYYLGTKRGTLEQMLLLAEVQPGERAVDIGSGDGRIVIALAKAGAEAYGYEINPVLVWWSRRKIRNARLQERAFVYWKNFWSQNFSSFDIVTVYGIPYIMKELEQRLQKELKPSARVVSNGLSFPTWSCERTQGRARLYVK